MVVVMNQDHLTAIREARQDHAETVRIQERSASRFARAVREARDAGVSVSDIADAAGISRQGIYKLLGSDTGREDPTREEGNVNYWLVSSGTTEEPHIHDDWRPRRDTWVEEYGDVWQFTRRPRIVPGDRLVTYAVGSGRSFGKGRVFSLYEVTSEPEPGEHERWGWKVDVRYLAGVPLLSQSPTLDDIGVSPMSVRRQTHIRLTPEQGRRAEELITARVSK
jgi:DNA-binding phage protein